jgi:hypothetical protein
MALPLFAAFYPDDDNPPEPAETDVYALTGNISGVEARSDRKMKNKHTKKVVSN